MSQVMLLREFLRCARRVKLRPSADGFKKLEYLKFIGADQCPTCGEDVDLSAYRCTRDEEAGVSERYLCPACGADFVFPQDPIQ